MSNNIYTRRKDAKNNNAKTYYTGKPCMRGHKAKRRTDNGQCLECAKQLNKQWQQNNPEKKKISESI